MGCKENEEPQTEASQVKRIWVTCGLAWETWEATLGDQRGIQTYLTAYILCAFVFPTIHQKPSPFGTQGWM